MFFDPERKFILIRYISRVRSVEEDAFLRGDFAVQGIVCMWDTNTKGRILLRANSVDKTWFWNVGFWVFILKIIGDYLWFCEQTGRRLRLQFRTLF